MRLRSRTLAAPAAAGLVLLAGCSSSTAGSGELSVPGVNDLNTALLPGVPAGTPESFGALTLCTIGAPVVITGASPVDPTGGMRITWWGVRPWHGGDYGQVEGAFPASYGFVTGDAAVVSVHCPPSPDAPMTEVFTEFAATFVHDQPQTGTSQAIDVSYRSGDTTGTLRLLYAVTLCDPSDVAGDCKP